MEIKKISLKNTIVGDIKKIATFFKKGKIVVYPTDTVYGIGCLATDKKGIAKVFKIKKRDKSKALLVLISSLRMLEKYFLVSLKEKQYLKKVWPGPISVVLRKKSILPKDLALGKDRVAVRLPKNDFLIKMIRRVKAPIVSTSLNISGKRTLTSITGLEKQFSGLKPDLAVDGGNLLGRPSKLLDISNPEKIIILRK